MLAAIPNEGLHIRHPHPTDMRKPLLLDLHALTAAFVRQVFADTLPTLFQPELFRLSRPDPTCLGLRWLVPGPSCNLQLLLSSGGPGGSPAASRTGLGGGGGGGGGRTYGVDDEVDVPSYTLPLASEHSAGQIDLFVTSARNRCVSGSHRFYPVRLRRTRTPPTRVIYPASGL